MPHVASHPANQPSWFDLMTSDAAAARQFYHALFGWEMQEGGPETGGYTMCLLEGEPVAGIGQIAAGQEIPPAWTVYFGVDDADAITNAVAAAGGAVLMPTMNVLDFGRMAVCQDPTGAVFGLWQPGRHVGAGLVDDPGSMTWCEVNTRDADAACAFYEQVFGLRRERADMERTTYFMLHNHDAPVAGVLQMTPEWGDMPPHWMPYFRVADADGAKARVLDAGGQVPFGPFDTPYGRIVVMLDPQGAALSLIGPAPAS